MPRLSSSARPLTKEDYELLAEFRYTLRKFFGFSEAAALEHGVTPVSWSPLAGGWLGDGGAVPEGHPRAAALRGLLDTLDAMARERGVSRTVLVLAWLLRHPARIVPLVGSTNPARIRDAAKADDVELSREDWYTILVAARGAGLP